MQIYIKLKYTFYYSLGVCNIVHLYAILAESSRSYDVFKTHMIKKAFVSILIFRPTNTE